MTPAPPSLSSRVLTYASRHLQTPELAADAAELFARFSSSHGRRWAARWYRAQARAALRRLAADQAARVRNRLRRPVSGLSLDARLGVRMLRRYPGLTLIGGLAMAFAVFVGAALFEFIGQTLPSRTLPVPHGEQVVGLRLWNRDTNRPQSPTVADLAQWATHLRTIQTVGGFATRTHTIETATGFTAQVHTALMTPSGFELAGVAPLLGRVFTNDDLQGGAAPVSVISLHTWRTLFDGRSNVVGQPLRVGGTLTTVIGVMPDTFKFPINHNFWLPLDLRTGDVDGLRGFGRIADGLSLDQAQAELTAVGRGATPAAATPVLLPRVQWYRESMFDVPVTLLLRTLVQQLNLFAAMFLLLVSANIALLMFARAAARERELVVRSALGASRRRIVVQFLIEALTLFGASAALGLLAVGPGLSWIEREIGLMGGGTSPFWFTPTVSPTTIVYALLLTTMAAVIAGGLPALRATRQLSNSRLQEATAGAGRLRLGGIWTAVVVTQVTATVVFTAGAALMWRQAHRSGAADSRFSATEYVAVTVQGDNTYTGPVRHARLELVAEALLAEPGVSSAAIATRLPLMTHGAQLIEVDGLPPVEVSMPSVGAGFFDTFRATLIDGRFLTGGRGDAGTVVVDDIFVREVLSGTNPVGRRLRVLDPEARSAPGTWLEIVGVIKSLQTGRSNSLVLDDQRRPFVYRSIDPATSPVITHLAVHVPSAAPAALPRLRQAVARADARMNVLDIQTLDQVVSAEAAFWRLWARLVLMVSVVTLVLALAGIYAVMSFTVTRRTREIGIRMALGARGGRVALEVLRHPLRQLGAGLVAGCAVVLALFLWVRGDVTATELGLLGVFAATVTCVCLLAVLGPARRAIAVHPSRSLGASE